ncbi:MAG: type II toxin-antitoxin system RelE/ParE family toxin [Coraliomargarita sp.]
MKLRILEPAERDLIRGFHFYESQAVGVGSYFLDCLYSDIDSLLLYAGIHRKQYGLRWMLSKRFPYAIYYLIEVETIIVHAVLDCRQNPQRQQERLRR